MQVYFYYRPCSSCHKRSISYQKKWYHSTNHFFYTLKKSNFRPVRSILCLPVLDFDWLNKKIKDFSAILLCLLPKNYRFVLLLVLVLITITIDINYYLKKTVKFGHFCWLCGKSLDHPLKKPATTIKYRLNFCIQVFYLNRCQYNYRFSLFNSRVQTFMYKWIFKLLNSL